jgi:hypothetical protein
MVHHRRISGTRRTAFPQPLLPHGFPAALPRDLACPVRLPCYTVRNRRADTYLASGCSVLTVDRGILRAGSCEKAMPDGCGSKSGTRARQGRRQRSLLAFGGRLGRSKFRTHLSQVSHARPARSGFRTEFSNSPYMPLVAQPAGRASSIG